MAAIASLSEPHLPAPPVHQPPGVPSRPGKQTFLGLERALSLPQELQGIAGGSVELYPVDFAGLLSLHVQAGLHLAVLVVNVPGPEPEKVPGPEGGVHAQGEERIVAGTRVPEPVLNGG